MRIAVLTPGFPADENDSTCLPAIQNFVRSVSRRQNGCTLVVFAFQYPFTGKQYEWNGVTVHALGGGNRAGLKRLFTWARAFLLVRKMHRSEPFDGILSLWLSECALVGSWLSRFCKLQHFVWLQGQDVRADNPYVARVRMQASQLIAISHDNAARYRENFGVLPGHIAENGIDIMAFPQLSLERRIDILGVGSLSAIKNFMRFIQTVAKVRERFPEVRAVLAGEGPERVALERLAADLGLSGNIVFTGKLEHQEVLRFMNASRLLLHTAHSEGSAGVIIEALYSGCSVVSTVPLSPVPVENFYRTDEPSEVVSMLLGRAIEPKRILYNDMDTTAEKIVELFRRNTK